MRVATAAVIGSIFLSLAVGPAAALDLGEWVPGLKLSPFLSERVEYETNIFQAPSHAQDDVIFKTIPGFVVDYTFGSHSLSAGYRAEILNYFDLTEQDTVHHIAAGQLRLDFPRTLVNIREDFVRTSDPPGTELTGRVLSNTNTFKPEVEYRFTPRLSAGLAYTWLNTRFDDEDIGDLIDRDEHVVVASVYWKFTPRADVGLNYGYGQTDFVTSDRNYTRHLATASVRGDVTAKLSSGFQIGWEFREPDNSDLESGSGFFMRGDWTYRPTERTVITLSTERSIQESTFETTTFYTTTSAQLLVQHQLLPKLSIGARIGGGVNDYSSKQTVFAETDWRRDWFMAAGANVEYTIQPWLRVGAEWLRTSRDSNFAPFDFVDDRITGRVTLQF
jgi:hypothetical protein